MPPKKADLPSTLQRSPKKAQRTYAETLESAEETYDSSQRAHRTAWAAVKHGFEKVGDHWEAKDELGPSDAPGETKGGVDATKTKAELYEQAKDAGVEGRSSMDKDELVEAIRKANDRATREARSDA